MATQPRSRDSSSEPSSRRDTPQLRLLRVPDPNVFSDDYAIDPDDISAESTPIDPFPDHARFSNPGTSQVPDRSTSNASTRSTRPNPASKTTHAVQDGPGFLYRSLSSASNAESGTHRTSSTSSRFSMPRSRSPYAPPTGPSHPYGLYPQVTRASSISSDSTVRPTERAFLAPSAPEHPYAMYSQNIAPEEDGGDVPSTLIPLGFPGMGQRYQRGTRPAGNDIADIVGADGHVEELPRYTPYPDGLGPKEHIRQNTIPVRDLGQSQSDVPMSPPSTPTRYSDSGVALNVGAARTASDDSGSSLKERWKEKSRRRVCLGLPLWVTLVIIAIVVLAAGIGGVIGGVVASRNEREPADAQAESTPSSPSIPTASTWSDASPLPTNQPMPTAPCGQYIIPTDEIKVDSNMCIVNTLQLSGAWGCMTLGGIGITINQFGSGQEVVFDPHPINASFTYGPQPPNFHGRSFALSPVIDNNDPDLGEALFFSTDYNKLTILPEEDLAATSSKRSVRLSGLEVRDHGPPRTAQVGDNPWFCWFNQTVFELFIYVDQNTTGATSHGSQFSTTTTPPASSTRSTMPSPVTSLYDAGVNSKGSSYPTFIPTSFPTTYPSTWQPTSKATKDKRNYDGSQGEDYPNYPRVIKMEEKRKPNSEQPYCQQMTIQQDLSIIPVPNVATILVQARQPPSKRDPQYSSSSTWGSSCGCVWISTD